MTALNSLPFILPDAANVQFSSPAANNQNLMAVNRINAVVKSIFFVLLEGALLMVVLGSAMEL